MLAIRTWAPALAALTAGLCFQAAARPAGDDGPAKPAPAPAAVKIGMLKSMFREVPAQFVPAMAKPFRSLVKTQTGLDGEIVLADSPLDLRQRLVDNEVQLAVFHGFEYAWVKLKDPTLVPIMLAGTNPNALRAVVVVPANSEAQNVENLRGQTLALPVTAREHTRLYLSRRCPCDALSQQYFISQTPAPPSVEDALEEVVQGKAQVAVVEALALETFRNRKPGRFKRLRTLEQSEVFPSSVIAYRQGGLDNASVQKFKDGMSTAHKSAMGSRMMLMMKMTQFEPIPQNFDQTMAEIVKAYPPPW